MEEVKEGLEEKEKWEGWWMSSSGSRRRSREEEKGD